MAKILSLVCIVAVGFASFSLCDEKVEHGGASAHKSKHYSKDGGHNPVFDYEALMGSNDMDELAELPEDVRIKRLTNLATSHDANNNGTIEPDELKQWILESFRMLDKEEGIEKMKEDDEDLDGKVSFGEILHKQYGYTEEDVENMMKEEQEEDDTDVVELIGDDRKRFAAADVDGDGFLDENEYLAYFQPYDYPHMHAVEMEKSIKDMDKDKDGSVSMEEFIGESADEESRLSEKTNFEELDKDKDGTLTPEELRPWALPNNDEVANEEVEHLLKMCDTNEDGNLSIEEIVEKEDEFVSSSATDYGRNLHFVRDEL